MEVNHIDDRTRSIIRALAGRIFVIGGIFAGTFLLMLFASEWVEMLPEKITKRCLPVLVFVYLAAPFGAAFAAWKWLDYHGRLTLPMLPIAERPRKWARKVLIAGYALTVIFGIPAVQTHVDRWAVAEYKRMAERDKAFHVPQRDNDLPYMATYAALPVAPGVLVTFHGYAVTGLYGFVGFRLFLWYGWGVVDVGNMPLIVI